MRNRKCRLADLKKKIQLNSGNKKLNKQQQNLSGWVENQNSAIKGISTVGCKSKEIIQRSDRWSSKDGRYEGEVKRYGGC